MLLLFYVFRAVKVGIRELTRLITGWAGLGWNFIKNFNTDWFLTQLT